MTLELQGHDRKAADVSDTTTAQKKSKDAPAGVLKQENPISEYEQALYEKALQQDDSAIAELYNLYRDKIHTYVINRTKDEDITEEIVSEVFLKMVAAIKKGGNTWRSSFSGWLFRIAHNLMVDHWEKKARRPTTTIPDDDDTGQLGEVVDPADKALQNIGFETISHHIGQLTNEQQKVIRSRFVLGHTIEEVAAMTDSSESAVKALQHRAIQALKKGLAVTPDGRSAPAESSTNNLEVILTALGTLKDRYGDLEQIANRLEFWLGKNNHTTLIPPSKEEMTLVDYLQKRNEKYKSGILTTLQRLDMHLKSKSPPPKTT